jgi:hypothetical protein
VDFAVQELLSEGGTVPDGLTVPVTANTCRMRGTDHTPPRCAALTVVSSASPSVRAPFGTAGRALMGHIGIRATCGIYEWRPNPCREFEEGSAACAAARARHGFPPLPELLGRD